MPTKMLLVGPPGSGKGLQSVQMRERYAGMCYIDAGEALRHEIKTSTAIGNEARALMHGGTVVPDALLVAAVLPRVRNAKCVENGYILDGLPRTAEQARLLAAAGETIDAVVTMDVTDATLAHRMAGRWVHLPSGRVYHQTLAPPRQPFVDDETGEALKQRADDRDDLVPVKIAKYRRDIAAVGAFYRQEPRGGASGGAEGDAQPEFQRTVPSFVAVDGAPAPDRVWQLLSAAIDGILVAEKKPWWKLW
jgi:adenylate kinase